MTGANAEEVLAVSKALAEQRARHAAERRMSSPWISGSFYLSCSVVIITALLVVGRLLSPWALPGVLVGSVILLTIVGAFQQRQDERLGERNFLQLMATTLRYLPRLGRQALPQDPQAQDAQDTGKPTA